MERYLVTAQFYVYGQKEQNAQKELKEIINLIDKKYDNKINVVQMINAPFGKIK